MTPVASVAVPIPNRLMTGLKVSATQPNSVMPSIAKAMVPVLKTPNTRASISLGAISCRVAETTGVTNPELPPMSTINRAAATGTGMIVIPNTARPPTMDAPTIIHNRSWKSAVCLHANHAVVLKTPMLSADHNQPIATESACNNCLPITGNK